MEIRQTLILCKLFVVHFFLHQYASHFFRYTVTVEVYSCEMLAKHCDECLGLPLRFGCGWCISGTSTASTSATHVTCTARRQCLGQELSQHGISSISRPKWLQSGSLCPNPQITSVSCNYFCFPFIVHTFCPTGDFASICCHC